MPRGRSTPESLRASSSSRRLRATPRSGRTLPRKELLTTINRRNVLKASGALAMSGFGPVAGRATGFGGLADLRPGERYVKVPGGRVWVNVVGGGRGLPLLVLHGGPGAGPYPEALLRSAANIDGNQVYATMNGPNEFVMTGNLASWDRTAQLHRIKHPVLLTRGRYDEFTVDCMDTLEKHLPKVIDRVEFPNSAHMATREDRPAYMQTLGSFLSRRDHTD